MNSNTSQNYCRNAQLLTPADKAFNVLFDWDARFLFIRYRDFLFFDKSNLLLFRYWWHRQFAFSTIAVHILYFIGVDVVEIDRFEFAHGKLINLLADFLIGRLGVIVFFERQETD